MENFPLESQQPVSDLNANDKEALGQDAMILETEINPSTEVDTNDIIVYSSQ